MIERQIVTAFDDTGCYIIINNGMHPDSPKYFAKMIACTRSAFNQMLNNKDIFERETGIKISDGYQKAWGNLKNIHQVKVDILAMAKFVASQDIKAGREQDYIEAEKELEALEQEPETKEVKNDDEGTETGTKPTPKKRAKSNKRLDV